MNIIINSLDRITCTGIMPDDFQSLKVFIAKTIEEDIANETFTLKNVDTGSIFFFTLLKDASLEKDRYLGYRIDKRSDAIAEGAYLVSHPKLSIAVMISVTGEGKKLIDEHHPILIIGRQINSITTPIVAQDARSQRFSFYMQTYHDGISIQNKAVYADYIPVDKSLLGVRAYLSTKLIVNQLLDPPLGQTGQWSELIWELPYAATKDAGVVKFAISVVDQSNINSIYTWQTFPSSFVVSPNLGRREEKQIVPEEEESSIEILANRVNEVEQTVQGLNSQLGNQLDNNDQNDDEIFFDGGDIESNV